jgi:pyruvate dehydrogenase E1 component alpha subunit
MTADLINAPSYPAAGPSKPDDAGFEVCLACGGWGSFVKDPTDASDPAPLAILDLGFALPLSFPGLWLPCVWELRRFNRETHGTGRRVLLDSAAGTAKPMPRTALDVYPQLEYLSILDEDGSVDNDLLPDLDDDFLLELHRVMLLSRRFDDRRLRWQRSGRIGTFAPVKGQEAAQIGAVAALDDTDWFVPSFRETAAATWRGGSFVSFVLYDAGFNEGGKVESGSRNLPIAVPVASQIPHAVGLAYAIRQRNADEVVMVFFGDGATSQGDFHEGLNFAGVFELPVVFVCQNNQWAISLPREEQTASRSIAQKAAAYGFPGLQVDGNDIFASYSAGREAVDRARSGDGPTLLEMCTYRLSVHTTADDPSKYRSEEEEEEWKQRDPLPRFQNYLGERGLLGSDDLEKLESEIENQIADVWNEAKQEMEVLAKDHEHIFEHVYAEMPRHLEAQRKSMTEQGGTGS